MPDHQKSTIPTGKGWVFTFADSQKTGWKTLKSNLSDSTREELTSRGWSEPEAELEVPDRELQDLERSGMITMLNRSHPLVRFERLQKQGVLVQCGQKLFDEDELREQIRAAAVAEISAEFPWVARIVSFISAKLGLKLEAEASAANTTKRTITIDLTKSSYLFDSYWMTDTATGRNSIILIEKEYDCEATTQPRPGDRIQRIRFTITREEIEADKQETIIDLRDATSYLPVPEDVISEIPRPVFISINSPEHHDRVVRALMKKWLIDINLAQFIVSEINYACASTDALNRPVRREKCLPAIEAALR